MTVLQIQKQLTKLAYEYAEAEETGNVPQMSDLEAQQTSLRNSMIAIYNQKNNDSYMYRDGNGGFTVVKL